MKWLYTISINILLLTNLHAKTTKELISKIANTNPTMQYVFWVTKNENSNTIAYLSRKREDSSFGVWHFTPDKKWLPIHNADKYDGFDKADNIFDNVSLDKTKEMITFTAIIKQPTDDVLNKTKLLENNTFNIGWYFWVYDKDAFLFSKRKNKEFSIWNFTSNKKWQPIHNAIKFNGFDKADKTLKDISFEESSGVLSIGGILDDTNSSLSSDAFIMTIKINVKSNSQNIIDRDRTYKIYTNYNKYTYNYSVDCDSDGIKEAENLEDAYVCKYKENGIYDVSIEGLYPHRPDYSDSKLIDIKQWGNIKWKDMSHSFDGAHNMKMSAKDKPNLSEVTNMSGMFYGAKSFNQDIGDWDVSKVEDMGFMFHDATLFNQDIGDWDVSKVENMSGMFDDAKSFNQDIGDWDVSKVENMSGMFELAKSFNQDIGDWDVSKVKDMSIMFSNAKSFNQDIGDWDVSKVEDMGVMFQNAKSFNQDIGDWDVSKVEDMGIAFHSADSFNQDIGDWDVSKVKRMYSMFHSADSFNQDIGDWDVSKVKNMGAMFGYTKYFNQDLTRWKINLKKTITKDMFKEATAMEEKNKPEGI